MKHLIAPHGGKLVDLMVKPERIEELKKESMGWPSWDLSPRQLRDVESLLNGGFSPLKGFMGRGDYESVRDDMRLTDGVLWPMPILLDVDEAFAANVKAGDRIALRDPEGVMLAALTVSDKWELDKAREAEVVYGTASEGHPGVAHLFNEIGRWCLGGDLEGLQLPQHYDYRGLRLTPREAREDFVRLGWRRIIAFHTRTPMHRVHYEMTTRAVREHEANLLLHPLAGMTNPGEVDHYTRVRCYKAVMRHYPKETAKLALLPLAMRMAGPREALWHALVRKNYGCGLFIVGRDHAGPGKDSSGKPFYDPHAAQELLKTHANETGVEMVPFSMMAYLPKRDVYRPMDEIEEGTRTASFSDTELRARLTAGREIPKWFTFPEVAEELRRAHPPRRRQGFTVFFTGLSGSGKSTIANALLVKLLEMGGRPATLLDGDIVRKNLSSELGFSKEHRDLNVRRIGFVANEITKNGGIAICAPIAPYDAIRKELRSLIEQSGGFILIHVSTPLEVCEKRDRKGLYAKARAGMIKEFTGISNPYEEPVDADATIDTSVMSPEEAAQTVLLQVEREGYIGRN